MGAENRASWIACAKTEAAEPGLQMLIDLVDEWRAKVRALLCTSNSSRVPANRSSDVRFIAL